MSIFKAVLTGSIMLFLTFILAWGAAYGYEFPTFSLMVIVDVFMVDMLLLMGLIGGARFSYRILHEIYFYPKSNATRCLIVGAGGAGARLVREIKQDPKLAYNPVAFIDGDPQRQNMRIHGIPVVGGLEDIARVIRKYNIQEVIICFVSDFRKNVVELINKCKHLPVRFKVVTQVSAVLNGESNFYLMQAIDMGDLLVREPINLDVEGIKSFLDGQSVLVTGAGGSIGSELCRQLVKYQPKILVLLDRAENNLYYITLELEKTPGLAKIISTIGDVTDRRKVDLILSAFKPSIIFHAAAHKHVPLMELHPEEAVKNNVIGTKSIAEAAHKSKVKTFVFISTDKAVNPTSVMGASKRVGELLIQELNKRSSTKFITVRFGNVLNSDGSVVPLFKKQILDGGPITITHPEIKRFFMTIPEAAQLVIQAAAMGKGGEIFVLNMGEQVKIVDLARNMISLTGLLPDKDIKIVYTGLRPGEKLYEELFDQEEGIQPSIINDIHVAVNNHSHYDWHGLNQKLRELGRLGWLIDRAGIIQKLEEIVPTYRPSTYKSYGIDSFSSELFTNVVH